MNTFQEQFDFFKARWPQLRAAMQDGGVEAGIAYIRSFADPLERRVMFVFARQGMNGRSDAFEGGLENPSLDWLIAMADAGIAEMLAQAEAEADPELRNKRVDSANVISYNLGADLADAWGDRFTRTREHFLRGRQAGDACIRWRNELGKPPASFSIAYWVRGMHRLSLEEFHGARTDFAESLSFAEKDAAASSQPTELGPNAGFSVLLANGYLALAKGLCGEEDAAEHYARVLNCFRQQQAGVDAEVAEDASFGIEQLEQVRRKYVPHMAAAGGPA